MSGMIWRWFRQAEGPWRCNKAVKCSPGTVGVGWRWEKRRTAGNREGVTTWS